MLNILSGWQTANIKSLPVADGVQFNQGDWARADSNGKLVAMGASDVFDGSYQVFPVYVGNIRFYDTRKLGKVDVVTARSAILESDVMDAVSFKLGDPVFVKGGKLTDSTTAGATAKPVGYAVEDSGIGVHSSQAIVKFALA